MDKERLRMVTSTLPNSCDPTHEIVEISENGKVKFRCRKYMSPGECMTVPFLDCCKTSTNQLECDIHRGNMDMCPAEQQRREAAIKRRQEKLEAKKENNP